jgi:polyisoprenoid-binding protein YceI
MKQKFSLSLFLSALACTTFAVEAAPVTYEIDSRHTFPSFEADHMGGLSTWRGKFNNTSGKIVLDREAQTGTIDVTIDAKSVDFGLDDMNKHAMSDDMFAVEKYPTIKYQGKLASFKDGQPTAVEGTLTIRDVTKPVSLTIDRFKCMRHPMLGKEVCGANAVGKFSREDFGIDYGKNFGFNMDVSIQIQVEALRADAQEKT